MKDRPFSYRALFAVIYTTSVSSVYFALGVVAHHANGLTPVVFLIAGLFFGLAMMTYAEGASLHPERGGSAVFARYAFNELVSFVAGWAIFLDYTILIAVTALTVPSYLAAFWAPIGRGALEIAVALAVIALVAVDNLTGVSARRIRTRLLITIGDLIVQALIIVLGFVLVFDAHNLTASIHLGTAPSWSDLAFALPIAVIAFTGIEAAASIAGEVTASRKQVKLLVGPGSAVIVLIYVGISLVGVGALPVHDGVTALGTTHIKAPGPGRRRGVPSQMARRRAQVRRRDRRRAGVVRCRRGGDARSLPGWLLARDQPPDSERRRAPPRALGHAVRDHRRGRGRRRRARAAHEPRVPRRHLRVRGAVGVHDRARVDHRLAVPRARPRTPVQRAAVGHDLRRAACRSRRSSARSRRGWAGWHCSCSTPARATSGWPGCCPDWCCTSATASPNKSRFSSE